jgi:hypothetical protein
MYFIQFVPRSKHTLPPLKESKSNSVQRNNRTFLWEWYGIQEKRKCRYKSNHEVRWRNRCGCITYSDCVCNLSYTTCKAHAPQYIVLCDLSGATTFFNIISWTVRFSGEQKLLKIKCVLIVSIDFFWNISLTIKYPLFLSDLNLNFLDRFAKKYSNIEFRENTFSDSQVVPCEWMDRQTDMTKLLHSICFTQFCERA